MKQIKKISNIAGQFAVVNLILILVLTTSCEKDPGITLPDSALLGVIEDNVTVFEDNAEGAEVSVVFIEPALADGEVSVTFSDASYGTDFTTDPAGSADGLTLNVTEGQEALSFRVIPVNKAGTEEEPFTVNMEFAADGGVSFGPENSTSVSIVNRPEVLVRGSISSFGNNPVDIASNAKTLDIEGLGLTGDITVTVQGNQFSVSEDNLNFTREIVIPRSDAEKVANTLFFRYQPEASGSSQGSVTIESSSLAESIELDLSGTGVTSQQVAFTSFEEAVPGTDNYTSDGDAGTDHDLVNNAGEFPVDFTAAGGEIGYDATFLTDGGSGCVNDTVGVVNNLGGVDFLSYPDGNQGYAFFDVDGAAMKVTFDEVDISAFANVAVAIDVFITDATYEKGTGTPDFINIYVLDDQGKRADLLNTSDPDDIDNLLINDASPEGRWITVSYILEGSASARLVIEANTNRDDEGFYVDNVRFLSF